MEKKKRKEKPIFLAELVPAHFEKLTDMG